MLIRSTEEIFALFICIAFTVDACKDTYKDFQKHYMTQVEDTSPIIDNISISK